MATSHAEPVCAFFGLSPAYYGEARWRCRNYGDGQIFAKLEQRPQRFPNIANPEFRPPLALRHERQYQQVRS